MKIKIGHKKHDLLNFDFIRRYCLGVAVAICANIFFLRFSKNKKSNLIVLMGHQLNGNLKAFAEWLSSKQTEFDVAFFTDDPVYYALAKKRDEVVKVYSMQNLLHMKLASRAKAI